MVGHETRRFRVLGAEVLIRAIALVALAAGPALAQAIRVLDAQGEAGSQVALQVSWEAGGSGASGLTVDIGFDGHPIDVANNKPACTFTDAVRSVKEASSFSFRPPGCTVGTTCTAFRAGIISFNPDNNPLPVPEGVIYTCIFTIPADATPGQEFAFSVNKASFIVPTGAETDVTAASRGGVVRVVAPPPTDTPTATLAPPTFTPTIPPATPTPTRAPATLTPTRTPVTPGGGAAEEDGGCHIHAGASASSGWLLLIPVGVLALLCRRWRP